MADYFGSLKSLPPTLWIGRHIGVEKLDVVTELHQLEPCLVYGIMTLLDDASKSLWGGTIHAVRMCLLFFV